MNEKDKKAFFKRMQVLEKNLEDNNEEKLKKLTQLYIEKKSLGIVETKPNNNFEEIKEKLAKLFNMNFDKTYKQTHPFNLDVLKELKELKNQIKKALSTKDVSLIDSFMPLAAGFSQTRYNYDNFTNINFEYGLNKILKLPIEKKELVLQTLLDKTTKKINLFNFQLEDTQKKYLNTLNKINEYQEKLILMKNDSKIKQKKILDFVKHNEYLFENLIMYDLLLPDSHKIVKINSFKENEDFGSTMKEEFIQFINNIDVNKKNIMVINIENDFEVLPIINDVKNKHIDASYVMYLYKNSKSIDEFYKECENLYFPKHQFNNLLLTMYNMVKEPNCISYIIDIEKKLNGVENITFITKEQNTLIDKVDVISDFIESAKKGDEYFCINSEKYTTVINAEIYKKLEKESRKEEKKLETNEINIDLNDR